MNFKIFKETDSFSMNKTSNMKKVNNKPRYYVCILCANDKICFCKVMSYDLKKVENGYRLVLSGIVQKNHKFYNSSIDKTLFTKVDSCYVNDVKEYCDDVFFDGKESKIIFDFLMSSYANRKRFIEFCEDNNVNYIDFEAKLK